jgi:hypothetical protein
MKSAIDIEIDHQTSKALIAMENVTESLRIVATLNSAVDEERQNRSRAVAIDKAHIDSQYLSFDIRKLIQP